jgi:ADP-glucose pyrophosphorylase
MNPEDKVFAILGRYVFEHQVLSEQLEANKKEIERLKELLNKKKKKG